jgi:cbb3-type cytochrome oxidase subunit 1
VTALTAPRSSLPPRLLPVLYFGVAHVAFAVACLAVALDPRGVSGFFYHSRIVAIVHLVTLGWISASILGSLYVVGPVAMRVSIPATRLDYTAYALAVVGIIGMVAHFWIEEYGGMAWSALAVGAGIVLVGSHVARRLRRAPLPRAITAHVMLAFVNILAAATLGVLIGFDKVYHFLPGFVLANVFAHAHLAALGWATMMVVGVAYRLLPMILPAAMPADRVCGSARFCFRRA